jgi:hypothetical protein
LDKIRYDSNGDISKIKRADFPQQADFYFDDHRLNYNLIEKTKQPLNVLFYFHGMYNHSQDGGLLAKIVSN